ncbi:MAG TPA: alkaline phosphatase family protein [Tepidisphaeraceae bacterium]
MKISRRTALIEALEQRLVQSAAALPRPDHVVVLIEEDHSYSQLFAPPPASALQLWPVITPGLPTWYPNLRNLETASASFTHAHSVGNTNAVDYQALFSGLKPIGKQAISPTAPNIASELTDAGLSFAGYAQGLPSVGYTGGSVGDYSTTHNPWLPFSNFPRSNAQPFERFPDDKLSSLPTVSYIIPDQVHNMHSGSVNTADEWFQSNVEPYADWAMKHNSLLIVTWDESHAANDRIPTLFYGPMVKPGHYTQPITQENILRTLEDMYGLPPIGSAASATPITQIFKQSTPITNAKSKPVHKPKHHKTPTHVRNTQTSTPPTFSSVLIT